ncbi:hypothetical protein [Acinetobacter calcoaceticus]
MAQEFRLTIAVDSQVVLLLRDLENLVKFKTDFVINCGRFLIIKVLIIFSCTIAGL